MIKKEKKLNTTRSKKNLLDLFSTFYPRFYILETLLKKKLVEQIEAKLGAKWYDDVKHGFKLFQDETELITRRKKKDVQLTPSLFIHEASFGFWIELFGREPYKQLKGLPIQIFDNLPKDVKRNDLYRMLSNIKELRNQLYHHRIDLSRPLTSKELSSLRQAEKDLTFLIQSLDKSYTSLLSPSDFSKKFSKLDNKDI